MKRRFDWPHGRDQVNQDVDRELSFHLDERRRELIAAGASPDDADRAARDEFGDRASIESEVRTLRRDTVRARLRRNWWDDVGQDLRIAVRSLRRAPGFTVVALLTLALGIGANSAVFSVVNGVLLRPLPYPAAGQLVQLWTDQRARTGRAQPEWLTPPDFVDWREQNKTFSSMASYQNWAPTITGAGDPEALNGLMVSGDFFRTLGVSAEVGRTLTAADDDPAAEPVVVLSDAFWRTRFGGDRGIVNREIQLNGQSWRVVGVMPPAFRAPVAISMVVFRPVRRPATSGCGRGCIVLRAVGRLKPGITLAQAQADIGTIARHEAEAYPETNQKVGAWLIPLHEQVTGPTRQPLLALTAAVALVLLIACVNLANLLLLRGETRARELTVRAALGAGRGRLLRQLMTEGVLLAGIGGLLGLALAAVASRALAAVVPPIVQQMQQVAVNGTVVAFTALTTVTAGMLFSLLPAIRSTGYDHLGLLRSGVRAGNAHRNRLQHSLVAGQLALAVILLVGAGLLIRSLASMEHVDLGYRSEGVLFDALALPASRYDNARAMSMMSSILEQLRANPAIRSAEITDQPPLSAGDQDMTAIPVGEPFDPNAPPSLWYRATSPGYLQQMHLHLVAGRYFGNGDRAGSTPVGIVNAEAARKLWHGENPVGRTLAAGPEAAAPRLTVVGVIATDHADGPNQPVKGELFVPLGQVPVNGFTVVIEPAHGDAAAIAALRSTLHAADPLLPFAEPVAIESTVSDVVALPRLYAIVIGVFATVALALAIIGVYGVMAYVVAQRHREIGVRLALGASPSVIRRLMLWRGVRLAIIGAVAGLTGAAALTRLLGSLLFGVSATDPMTFAGVPLILGAVALVACWIPARRAMRIDPIEAIRAE
ncbi:MAG TPA: ABC transporter permease [Gemmatimonadales bacterium]|jgi:predicted permease